MGSVPAALASALMPDTPAFVAERYATLAERARTRSFGLLSDDVVILDTETTGLSAQENELIEISAARLEGGAIAERFDTFVHPTGPIPPEIMELTHITNADVAPCAERARRRGGAGRFCGRTAGGGAQRYV